MIRRKVEDRVSYLLLSVDEQAYEEETGNLIEAWIQSMGAVGDAPDLIKQTRDTFKQLRHATTHHAAWEKAHQLHKDIGTRRQNLIKAGKHKEAEVLEPVERRLFYSKEHHKSMFDQPPKLSIRRRLEKTRAKVANLRPARG